LHESKNKKGAYVDVPVPVCQLLEFYLKGSFNQEFYLFTSKGVPSNNCYGRNNLREKYNYATTGLDLDPETTYYSWKHTGVVKSYRSGIDIKALQIQGRWHSIDMMDKYLKSIGLIENTQFTSVMNLIEV